MSTSGDSCLDLQIRLESSKLVPLFDEMQAIGFPLLILEQNIQRLKKGSPDIGFTIYGFVYRKFQELFDARHVHLARYFVNEKVTDRESFAKTFFQALQDIIQHDPVLPFYQYSCPGHPLAKVEEIVKITRRLRALAHKRPQVEETAGPKPSDLHRPNKATERLTRGFSVGESFSSNKSLRGSISEVALIQPVNIAPVDIPWQAVREKRDRNAEQDASDSDDEHSPDEGIRSWNTSSILPEPGLPKSSPGRGKTSSMNASPERTGNLGRSRSTFSMERYSSDAESALRKLEQIEVLQDSKLRSIENRLMRMEYDFIDSNTRLERTIGSRLNDHEIRIQHLEHTAPIQSEERTRKLSVFDAGVGAPAGTGVLERQRSQSGYSHSLESDTRHRSFSRDVGGAGERVTDTEHRGSLAPSRHASISRSHVGDKERKDSRLSSTFVGSGNEESRQEHRLSRELHRDRTSSFHRSLDDHHARADTAEVPNSRATPSEPHRGSSFFDDHRDPAVTSSVHQHEPLERDLHANDATASSEPRRPSSLSRHTPEAARISSSLGQEYLKKSSSVHDFDQENEKRESRALKGLHDKKPESQRESSTDSHAGEPRLAAYAKEHMESPREQRRSSRIRQEGIREDFTEQMDNGQDMARFRTDVLAQTRHHERRHRSVGSRMDRKLTLSKEEQNGDALTDLNERIQLRLRERIKTAEDTLNACMETIRRDYVLLRRH